MPRARPIAIVCGHCPDKDDACAAQCEAAAPLPEALATSEAYQDCLTT